MEPKMLKDAFSFMFPPMIPTSIINHIIKTNMYKWTTMELRDTPPWKCMTRVLRSMGTSLSFSFLCLGTESPMLTRIPCREPTLAGSFDRPQNEIGWRVGTIEVFSSTPVPIHITPPFCGWMKRMNAPPPTKVLTRGTISFPISRSPRFWCGPGGRLGWDGMIRGWKWDVGEGCYLNN